MVVLFLFICILLVFFMVLIVHTNNNLQKSKPETEIIKIKDIETLFNQQDYQSIFDIANDHLQEFPFDNYWLRIRGVSSYQLATNHINNDNNDNNDIDIRNDFLDIAIHDLKRARVLKKDKDKEEIEIFLGKALYARGRFFKDSSIFHFVNALEMIESGQTDMDDKSIELNLRTIYHYLGSAWAEVGDFQRSIEYFEKVEAVSGSKNQLHIAVSWYNQKNYIKAYEYLEQVIQNSSDNNLRVSCMNWKAKIYFEEGKFYKAIKIYEDLIEEFPHSPDPVFRIGMVYYEMNNKVKARDYFRKAAQKDIKCPQANEALMTLY